ncbi:MAG: hypothetical protein MI755_21605 [Sphingomonadales bacterium]|nr:hypothetical protein [Sphingomonadales bacterium]
MKEALPSMPLLDREIASFERMKDDLEQHHMGKWVLFHSGEFVDAFDSLDNVAEAALTRFGRGPYLIRQVGAPPATLPASVMCRLAGADN